MIEILWASHREALPWDSADNISMFQESNQAGITYGRLGFWFVGRNWSDGRHELSRSRRHNRGSSGVRITCTHRFMPEIVTMCTWPWLSCGCIDCSQAVGCFIAAMERGPGIVLELNLRRYERISRLLMGYHR